MRKADLIYLAGFIDGEGCIFATSKKAQGSLTRERHYYPALHIAQKFPKILHEIRDIVGHGKVTPRSDGVAYTYKISGSKCEALLIELIPYLRCKKEQAKLASMLMSLHPADRAILHRDLQELKREEGSW